MKTRLLLALLTTLASGALFAAEAPKVGAAAPAFSLTDSNGQKHSLGEAKGKYVVLEWFNPGCPFVQKHYGSGNMQKLQEEFTKKGVVWYAVDSSAPGKEGHLTPELANKQMTDWKMRATAILIDADGKTGQAFGAKNTPHMFIINPDGKVVYEGAIDSKPSANPDDIAGATNYVKAALDESLAGKPISTANTKPYGCSVKY